AWEKRKALIICANRGIIEEALRMVEEVEEFKNINWIKKILSSNRKSPEELIPFDDGLKSKSSIDKLKFTSSILDFRSITLDKTDAVNIFDDLFLQAVNHENWSACDLCPEKST